MCAPIAVIAGAQIAAAAYTGLQQDRRAKALNQYQEVVHDANVEQANAAALDEFQALDRRQNQERARAASAVGDIARQARLAAGAAQAQSETTAGGSAAALIGEFERQAAQQRSNVGFNLEGVEAQLALERKAVRAREAGRIAGTIPNPIPGADWVGLGIGLASDLATTKLKIKQAQGTELGDPTSTVP